MTTIKRSVISRGQRRRDEQSTENFQDIETILYNTMIIDTCYYTFLKTHVHVRVGGSQKPSVSSIQFCCEHKKIALKIKPIFKIWVEQHFRIQDGGFQVCFYTIGNCHSNQQEPVTHVGTFATLRSSSSLCIYEILQNAFPKDLRLKLTIQASSPSSPN